MAPQPLTRVIPNAHVEIRPNALDERKELAPLVARAIATWSEIEHWLASILTVILHAHATPAIAIFYSLRSTSTQMTVVKAAANAALKDDDLLFFNAVMLVLKPLHKARNNLAHGRYGLSPQLPDAILLAPPEQNSEISAEIASSIGSDSPLKLSDFDREGILVYSKDELMRVNADLDQAQDIAVHFWHLLLRRDDVKGRKLSALPLMATALVRAREDRQTRQEADPSSL